MTVSPKVAWIAVLALLTFGGCKNQKSAANGGNSSAANPVGSSSSASSATSPNASGNSDSPASDQQANAQPPAPQPIVIRAGTLLHVTVDQPISSKTANAGDTFDASLADSVRVHGEVVLPRDARITGIVTSAESAGRFRGHAELGLALDAITVEGQRYRLHTSSVAEDTKGRGKRTAIGAGGGAAFGAILGAIAGGGKGAAIGAMAGGGAGTAGAAFTGKRDIEIPAETRLNFRLERAVSITPAS
jgi:hypothetical protein